jgi:hypothetical protein
MKRSRFGFKRRIKSKVVSSTVSLSEYKSKPVKPIQTPKEPSMTSQSLDGGKSRPPVLKFRKNIFKKKR